MTILLTEIHQLVETEKFDEAEKLCREYIEQDSEDFEGSILLGRIIANQGRHDEAITLLLEIAKTNPKNFDIHFLLGRIYEFLKEDFENALEHYRIAVSVDYRSSVVNYRIGKIFENYHYEEKNDDEAKRYYQNAVNGDTPIEDAFSCLALLEKSKRALVVLRHGLNHFPNSTKLYELLASKHLHFFSDAKECISVVKEATKKNVKSDELNFLAFRACLDLSQQQDALNFLDLINVEEHELDAMALKCIRAITLMEMRNFQSSIELLQEIIQNDLKNEVGYIAHDILMCSYFRAGEFQRALDIFLDIPIELECERSDFMLTLYPLGFFECHQYFRESLDSIIKSNTDKKTIALAKGLRATHLHNTLQEADVSMDEIDVSDVDLSTLENDLRSAIDFFPNNIMFSKTLGDVLYRCDKWFDSIRFLIKAQIYSDNEEYIEIKSLEKIYSNKSRFNKFFQIVSELVADDYLHEQRFAKFIMPDIIEFLFAKKEFQKIVDFSNQFNRKYWAKDKVLFNIAYSYTVIDDKKSAKKLYKEYLTIIGENQAVLNNLANIYSEEGDYSEAERLYKRSVELGGEISENNLANLEVKMKKAVEETQSWQRAVVLFAREDKMMRRVVARIYNEKLDNDLVLFSSTQMVDIFNGDINQLLQDIKNKKYFEVVDEHNFPSDSIVLRLNPILIEHVQKELVDEQKEKFFDEISTSLTAKHLDDKYGYNEKLVSKLSALHLSQLATILERDMREVILSLATQSYKAAIILCGSIVEAILLDRLFDLAPV